MDWIELADELLVPLRTGNLDECIRRVEKVLRELPATPFHHVLDLHFTNDIQAIAHRFDQFAQLEPSAPLAAIYAEMNGFYLNPDRWYFELFGYPVYSGHDNYDWLSRWSKQDAHQVTLTGMEPLQTVYHRDLEENTKPLSTDHSGDQRLVRDIADLLVVLRFQHLIRQSTAFMSVVKVPILATAHDYDFIAEVHPL